MGMYPPDVISEAFEQVEAEERQQQVQACVAELRLRAHRKSRWNRFISTLIRFLERIK